MWKIVQNLSKTGVKINNSIFILSIKQGLILAIPFLMLGSFALLFNTFPLEPYQDFLRECLQGKVVDLLTVLYDITLGSLALVFIFTVSISFGTLVGNDDVLCYPVLALCSYMAFTGGIEGQKDYIFGAEWVFTALCITLISCTFFQLGMKYCRRFQRLHTIGADYVFNLAMKSLLPIVVIVLFFAVSGSVLRFFMGDKSITNFGSYIFMGLFEKIGTNLFSVLLYIFLSHVLWFFGIHGTNTLEAVSRQLFEQGIQNNQAMAAAGQVPTEIFSKTFLDVFVFIGGCGTTFCMILALLAVAKKSHNRRLAKFSCLPVLFNISESVVFGFPVIFNPIMIIPFIVTPLVLALTSSAAMKLGWVPVPTHSLEWTVPVLLSGYRSTGAWSGAVLQLFNLLLGTFIYIPFVRRSEEKQSREFQQDVQSMQKDMQQVEVTGKIVDFLDNRYKLRHSAKALSVDLKNALGRGQLELYYQMQTTRNGHIHGGEALLRWKHPVVGYISPPLLITLAALDGFAYEMGYHIIEKVCRDGQEMERRYGKPLHLSVNISALQLEDERFVKDVEGILKAYPPGEHTQLVFEITERVLMDTSAYMIEKISSLKNLGIQISMDDFGMGHSSLMYLQQSVFDEVKLDGSLVRHILENERSRNIVEGIIQMGNRLGFGVVAEFVETKEQKELLENMGCGVFQGYYYGKAEPLPVFLEQIQSPGISHTAKKNMDFI